MRIFLIAEVLVLILALVLAVMRSLPGPVFAPLRLLAMSYSILFRGVPTILVIFILGFGMPALELKGCPTATCSGAIVALTLVYSAYVAEVYRAGIESVHPSARNRRGPVLDLRRGQSLRYVDAPAGGQAGPSSAPERLHRPQKDSALVAVIGAIEALGKRRSPGRPSSTSRRTVLALLFLLITVRRCASPTG